MPSAIKNKGADLLEKISVTFQAKLLASLIKHIEKISGLVDLDLCSTQVRRDNFDVCCHADAKDWRNAIKTKYCLF